MRETDRHTVGADSERRSGQQEEIAVVCRLARRAVDLEGGDAASHEIYGEVSASVRELEPDADDARVVASAAVKLNREVIGDAADAGSALPRVLQR